MWGFQGAATHCDKTEPPLIPWCGLRTGNRAVLKPGAWDRGGIHVLVSSSWLLLSLAWDREQRLVLTQLLKPFLLLCHLLPGEDRPSLPAGSAQANSPMGSFRTWTAHTLVSKTQGADP